MLATTLYVVEVRHGLLYSGMEVAIHLSGIRAVARLAVVIIVLLAGRRRAFRNDQYVLSVGSNTVSVEVSDCTMDD